MCLQVKVCVHLYNDVMCLYVITQHAYTDPVLLRISHMVRLNPHLGCCRQNRQRMFCVLEMQVFKRKKVAESRIENYSQQIIATTCIKIRKHFTTNQLSHLPIFLTQLELLLLTVSLTKLLTMFAASQKAAVMSANRHSIHLPQDAKNLTLYTHIEYSLQVLLS